MLGSLAAFETDGADPELGLPLVGEARQQIGATPHPSPRAWLDATEALSFATARRDAEAASHALTRAARAITAGQAGRPPHRCRGRQVYLRCTCLVPGPAASIGDLRCREPV